MILKFLSFMLVLLKKSVRNIVPVVCVKYAGKYSIKFLNWLVSIFTEYSTCRFQFKNVCKW